MLRKYLFRAGLKAIVTLQYVFRPLHGIKKKCVTQEIVRSTRGNPWPSQYENKEAMFATNQNILRYTYDVNGVIDDW